MMLLHNFVLKENMMWYQMQLSYIENYANKDKIFDMNDRNKIKIGLNFLGFFIFGIYNALLAVCRQLYLDEIAMT